MTVPIYEGVALSSRGKIATAEQQAAVAAYGRAVLVAFGETETALSDRTEAVRISRVQYMAGPADLLSVLQLQADQIADPITVIQLRNAQRANASTCTWRSVAVMTQVPKISAMVMEKPGRTSSPSSSSEPASTRGAKGERKTLTSSRTGFTTQTMPLPAAR